MICTLSVKAIKAYADYNRSKANGSDLDGKISELKNIVSNALSVLDSERNWLRGKWEASTENIKYYYKLCCKKAEEIRFWYNETPERRTIRRTKTVEVINADGSRGTREEEKVITYTDPYHGQLKKMLEQAEEAVREIESLSRSCWDCEKYLDEFDAAKSAFERASQDAICVVEDIEKSMREHLNGLAEQSLTAAGYVKSARAARGSLPEISGSGTVDLDALGSYISGLQSKLEVCTAEANKLVRAAEDLNGGWNDGVYRKFYNDTVEIRNEVITIVKELEYIKDALEGMYNALRDYTAVVPRVDYKLIHFNYQPTSLAGSGSSASVSAEIKI